MYTFDKKFTVQVIGQDGQTFTGLVPDQVAADQNDYWNHEWSFPVRTGDRYVVGQIDGEATGLETPGTGDLVVRDITEYDESGDVTTAQVVAQLIGDGSDWDTDDGVSDLEELADMMGSEAIYGKTVINDDGKTQVVETWSGDHMTNDPMRIVFDDGSALVAVGGAWDLEGREPFS